MSLMQRKVKNRLLGKLQGPRMEEKKPSSLHDLPRELPSAPRLMPNLPACLLACRRVEGLWWMRGVGHYLYRPWQAMLGSTSRALDLAGRLQNCCRPVPFLPAQSLKLVRWMSVCSAKA